MSKISRQLQIAVVGDIHGQWDDQDVSALVSLDIDLVLFVGDFGNEDLDLVQRIAQVPMPIAVVFGNHDAWYTATPWGRQKCPYDRRQVDRVQDQMAAVGKSHVGYGRKDFQAWQFSVVGGRPFSWGGPDWKYADFYAERFGVGSLAESGDRIAQAALQAPFETVIVLNHNGPTGLGSTPEDPCGRDWQPIGGDYGDPDLADSIQVAKASGKSVPLVAFGHMHHTLRHTRARLRQRVVVDGDGTVYLNAACVPRVMHLVSGCYRNFSIVQLGQGQVGQVKSLWVA
ncbi:MAG: TIGR04168 family protein, partial [Thermosynechococcaceae cyanobacterium]